MEGREGGSPVIEIVVPVYNEEHVLEQSIRRLRGYLDESFPFTAVVTIADNASVDGTWAVAQRLARVSGVRAIHLGQKGRGRALRHAWMASEAEVVAYMDVDLSTDLRALLPLVAPLISGHSDVAIGSRLAHGARVGRGPRREVISRLYNLTIKAAMRNGFTDAQCGFKAIRADAAASLIPLVADQGWFFDTELLVLAEANGMRIHEVPVDWTDDPDSRVRVVSTALGDLRGLVRVSRQLAAGGGRVDRPLARVRQMDTTTSRFAGIGGVSTVLYLTLLGVLAQLTGIFEANGVALAVAATFNFGTHHGAAHGLPSRAWARRTVRGFLRESFIAFAAGLALSTGFLAVTRVVVPSIGAELAAVVAANALVSTARYVRLRAQLLAGGPETSASTWDLAVANAPAPSAAL